MVKLSDHFCRLAAGMEGEEEEKGGKLRFSTVPPASVIFDAVATYRKFPGLTYEPPRVLP